MKNAHAKGKGPELRFRAFVGWRGEWHVGELTKPTFMFQSLRLARLRETAEKERTKNEESGLVSGGDPFARAAT